MFPAAATCGSTAIAYSFIKKLKYPSCLGSIQHGGYNADVAAILDNLNTAQESWA